MKFTKYVFLYLTLIFLLGCQTLLTSMKPKTTFLSGKEVGPASFSPDGNEIVFSIGNTKISNIYKVRVDGTGLLALTTGDTYDYGPVYSPDGTKILFSSMSDGKQGDLCLIKADGSEKVFLTTGHAHDFSPIFSPDGKKVFFIRAEWFGNYSPIALPSWHEMDIYSIAIGGTNLNRITSNRYFRIANLSIHPDGSTLMARITDSQSPYSIWTFPIDNPADKTPVRPDLDAYKSKIPLFNMKTISYDSLFNPEFSPDGSSLLFTGEGQYNQVYTMELKTNKAQRVTNMEKHGMKKHIYDPHFSMDGSHIIFRTVDYDSDGFFSYKSDTTIWTVNKDGSGLRAVEIK